MLLWLHHHRFWQHYTSRKEIRSKACTLFDSLSKIETAPFFDVTKSLACVLFPSISEETATWLAKTTGSNPLLITHYNIDLSSQRYKEVIHDSLHPWWFEIHDLLIPGDPHLGSTRSLFLPLYFQRPIAEFNLFNFVACSLLPVLCKIIYLDSTDTPQLYFKMHPNVIEETITSLSVKLGAKSDESAVIGFSYELLVLPFVSETVLDTLTSSGTSVETSDLPKLPVTPNRFDPALPTSLVNIIQMTVKLQDNCDTSINTNI